MRVMVLGGAGDMGAEAVRDLVASPDVEAVTIADLNVDAAQRLATEAGESKARVHAIDATSHEDLVAAMRGHDVIAGALGPFYRFERPIVEAALAAEIDYVSICDDHDAMSAVLDLDEVARQSGRRILSGMGWTPGLSNMLARKGYDLLDEVDSIRIYWAGSAGDTSGFAVVLHTLHIFGGTVVSYLDGRHTEVRAGSEPETVEFPEPIGEVRTFHLGHPEPVTIPANLRRTNEVVLKGGLVENYLNSLSRTVSALGLTSTPKRKQVLGRIMKGLMPIFPVHGERAYSGIRVDIRGRVGGEPVRLSYAAVDRMRRLTGIPLSIGAQMMGKGEIAATGVFGPEADGAVAPGIFLDRLATRGIEVTETRS